MIKGKKIILGFLAFLGLSAIIAGIFIFYFITRVDYKYTGEQIFEEVNSYRVSKNISKLELEPILCDNLVERWLAIKEPGNAHKGFEEWLKAEGISDNPKFGQIGELYVVDVSTPENAINFWLGSPGHRSTLEMKEMAFACAYANDGAAVVIMASKGISQ